jgi:non-specific serine/threonine protein kinase
MPPDVFISYSSMDKAYADAVCNALESNGYGCWIAPRNIVPGQEWSEAIIDGINGCRAVVLIFSSHSNASPQVLREVERTINKRIPLVPFRVENVPLSKAMEYFISVPHWLEAHTPPLEPHLDNLVRTVQVLVPRGEASPDSVLSVPPLALDIPSPTYAAPVPHNFPTHVTDFVGRDAEVQALHGLLEGGARLVTLSGMGGCGKTRIAYEVAAQRSLKYPGGSWWIDLASVQDPSLVLRTIADVLEIKDDPSVPLLKRLAERLQSDKTLLVLDNFEQVTAASPEIGELIRSCPSLTILVTSREVLNLSSEHEFNIPPMTSEEAVNLFVTRAQQVKAGFSLDDASRIVAERLCQKLDGIPLAIELAAAQVRLLKVNQIEKQLSQRFKTLVSTFGDVSQRQRTLRAAVDWSYDLLTEDEQLLFASLSVFQGGFSLDAVEAVCENDDAYSGVVRLREKSLLSLDDTLEVPRFNMLETLREYGAEKLRERGLTDTLTEKHARYFLEFAKERGPEVRGANADEAMADLAADVDDLRAAWEWLFQQPEADGVADMTLSLLGFWEQQGYLREGRERLLRCLTREEEINDKHRVAQLLTDTGWFNYLHADFTAATTYSQRSLNLARETEDRVVQMNALSNLALAEQAQGKLEEALNLFEESLGLAQSLGDIRKQADRLSNMSLVASRKGNLEQAREYLEEARALFQRLRDSFGTAACLCNLSDLALQQEDWAGAEEFARQSLDLFRRLNLPQGISLSLTNMALAETRRGNNATALGQIREALDISINTGAHWLVPILLELLGENRAALNEVREGLYCLRAASQLRETMASPRTPEEQAHMDEIEEPLVQALGESAVRTLQIGLMGQPLEAIIEEVLHSEGQIIA